MNEINFDKGIEYEELCRIIDGELARKGSLFPKQENTTCEAVLDMVWVATEPPKNSDAFYDISIDDKKGWKSWHPKKRVYIALVDNRITQIDNLTDMITALKIDDNGILLGTNTGEFDYMCLGSVYFANGKEVMVSGNQIRYLSKDGESYALETELCSLGFCETDNTILAFTGLSHMGSNYGYLYEIKYDGIRWTANKLIELDGCPNTYLLVDKTLYLTAGNKILIIEESRIVKSIALDGFEAMFTTSMLYSNEKLYIGMCGGMMVIDLSDYSVSWYTLREC